jgi:Leucine-rich repeat (LRR) protein
VNDCEALLDSEDALGGSLNWADDTPMSDWDGVTMSGDRVTAVNLRDQGLDGMISAALGRLSELTSLNLRSNAELSGEIPGSLNDLSDLTVLNLHSNSHTGEIPDLSGTSLVELYLPGNELTGSVPAWLNTMTDMTELWLWGNNLSGMMPNLSDMTNLDKLKLNGNSALSGVDAAMLPGGLRWLIIGQTDIGATAPDLSGMMSLTTLWMNETGLSGAIPVASIPTSVRVVNLKDNSLSGTIPDMSGLDNLRYLRLHRNDLSGDIPGTLGDMASIERIWLYENDLTGIAAGFANADDTLTHLYLDGNSFAEGTCLPGGLADVANNDFEAAGLAACQ